LVLGLRLTRFDIRATATTEIYTLSLHDALPIFEKWTRHAHTAVSHKATEVSRWFDSHPSGHDRALILSAAMLEGSSTDAVWEARKELRRTVQFAEPDAPPLEHQGLSGHLDTVGFEVDGYRRVRFRRTD